MTYDLNTLADIILFPTFEVGIKRIDQNGMFELARSVLGKESFRIHIPSTITIFFKLEKKNGKENPIQYRRIRDEK